MPNIQKLSINQIKFLRGITHGLSPIIMIGSKGVTDSLMKELEIALSHHELIKAKIAIGEKEDRKEIIDYIIGQTKAVLVQAVGKTFVIYRPKKDPVLELPK